MSGPGRVSTQSAESPEELRRKRESEPSGETAESISLATPGAARTPRGVLALQRALGNQRVGSILRAASPASAGRVDRAILPALPAEPTYQDGLNLNTIVTTALDKTPRPVLKPTVTDPPWGGGANANTRKIMKALFGDDKSKWDLASPLLLQSGEIHGNQVYENKSGDLPGDATYKEYDIATYKGDPAARGSDRVVIGDKGGTKTHYYTNDHYKNFAPFTPK